MTKAKLRIAACEREDEYSAAEHAYDIRARAGHLQSAMERGDWVIVERAIADIYFSLRHLEIKLYGRGGKGYHVVTVHRPS